MFQQTSSWWLNYNFGIQFKLAILAQNYTYFFLLQTDRGHNLCYKTNCILFI